MQKEIIYFTDNCLDEDFAKLFRKRLVAAADGIPIISVSHKPIDLGKNICVGDIGRSMRSLWRQVLTGVMYSNADVVYIAEHDVLYHESHFDFVPTDENCFYYDNSVWLVRSRDGRCLWKPNLCFSQCVCNRLIMLDDMMQRVNWCENGGDPPLHVGAYEPGRIRKKRPDERKIFGINTDMKWRLERFETEIACIDIRHGRNFSGTRRFKPKPEYVATGRHGDRIYADEVPGWGSPRGRFNEWLREVA
jgi:hypothetical protein